jgi:AAA+ ATPase superfamily predicted ATPase
MNSVMNVNRFSNFLAAKRKLRPFGLDPKRLHVSDKPKKKFYYEWEDGHRTYFGLMGYEDFLKHRDEARRQRFKTRNHKWAHAPMDSPAWFSYYITW